MNRIILYTSILLNVVSIGILTYHWRYLSLKYTWQYPPFLACDTLRIAYAQRFEPEFKKLDTYFAAHPDGQNMTDEVRAALRKMDTVQERGMQIEEICSQNVE